MKKILSFIILLLIITIFSQPVFAADFKVTMTDESLLVSKISGNSTSVRSVKIKTISDHKYLPLRALTEAFEGIIAWDNDTKSISITHNSNQIMVKNSSSSIFINGNKVSYEYEVVIIEGVSYAPFDIYRLFTNEYLDSVQIEETAETEDSFSFISGTLSDKFIFNGSFEIVNSMLLENPDRLVVDIRDFDVSVDTSSGETFNAIRTSVNEDKTSRIVFDLKEKFAYSIYQENGGIIFVVSKDGSFSQETIPFEIVNNSVRINVTDYSGYNLFRLSDPFRFVIDIPNQVISQEFTLPGNNELITEVKAYPYNGSTRYEISTVAQCTFDLLKNSDNLTLVITSPTVKGVDYFNFGDRKYIQINSISLASKADAKIKYYTQNISDDGLTYKITFSDPGKKIAAGQVYVNDEYLNSIYVERSGEKVTVIINAKKKFIYYINAETSNSHINILPYIEGKFVIIDPGHGGFDPGAINGDIYESNLNLDISLALKEMLEEQNIKTFILRETDEFVGIYERADIANAMGATMFVSVHINALDDPGFKGIMTLAYPGAVNTSKPNGKLLATMIQKEIILSTEAKDLGIIDRDKLVVLRDTTMPSVLVECGFITNKEELAALQDSEYQSKIASGMKEGIVKTLEYIR
ncbi:MAG: N-acetylmuramoyl-L-alanine amidase [Clostridia bacterium]|nr:N-acetylmuramoyl-L-alanine amidase [Clostridia bacterium]